MKGAFAVDYEWCKQLPVKVTEGHAAWLSRARKVVLVRPRDYASKSVHFILTFKAAVGESLSDKVAHCYIVPSFQQVQLLFTQRHPLLLKHHVQGH